MKTKFSIIILLGFLSLPLFAQKKIGNISKDNVLFARAINNKPAYIYFKVNNEGERLYYINYNDKDLGPFLFVYSGFPNYVNNHMANLVITMDNHFSIFSDGNIYGPYAVAYTWKFINDNEYLYAANEEYIDPDGMGFETKIYLDGKELPDVRDIIVSNKGNRAKVASEIASEKKIYVEYKNTRYGPYDNEILSIDFLADGETLVYRAEKNGEVYVAVNGNEMGPYEECSYLTFTEDKKHYAFNYKNNDKDVLVKDGMIVGTYYELDLYRFYEPTGELCVIEYDNEQQTVNLHYAGSTFKDIDFETVWFHSKKLNASKNSIMYFASTEGNKNPFRPEKNVYINEKMVEENVIEIYPSYSDIYDYAYITTKPIKRNKSTVYENDLNPFGSPDYLDDSQIRYYGSIDLYDGSIFNAECLVYKDSAYFLAGAVCSVNLLNKNDVFYSIRNMDGSLSFYINGNEIYTSKTDVSGDGLEVVSNGKDYVFFNIIYEDNWEQKVYYRGKIYPGSVINNQLVYVDDEIVYLKKY